MMMRSAPTAAMIVVFALAPWIASAVDGTPPSFVPRLDLSYVDPVSGEKVSCGEGCRRFEVPDGVVLDVRLRVINMGGDIGDGGVAWDLWFDQRRYPFPGLDLNACHDDSLDRIDIDCWRELDDRVDWEEWNALVADVVCVPETPDVCEDVTLRLPVDSKYDGSRGRGVYSLAFWVDRFRVMSDANEFDNFRGPVRVKVVPSEAEPKRASAPVDDGVEDVLVRGASSPRPFTVVKHPARRDISFTLSSQKSRGVLEFAPLYPGTVEVEVVQGGTFEKMIVEIRKASTGEVLAVGEGKGSLRFDGEVGFIALKDDRRLEVVVIPDHGTRGVRGTITVKYPARATYRRTE
jgi:hypothetical protein